MTHAFVHISTCRFACISSVNIGEDLSSSVISDHRDLIYFPLRDEADCHCLDRNLCHCCSWLAHMYIIRLQHKNRFMLYKFANYIVSEKWRLEKKNHDLVPELVACALTQMSFSHVNHRSGHESSAPIAVDMVTSGLQCCNHSGLHPEA